MRIEIICTGDEVLTGKTVNTNFSHISQKLEEVGLAVRWGTTVGDDRETLAEAFRQAAQRADVVIVNGGLGPTADDLSQEVAAQVAGVDLVLNEPWLERIAALFRRYNLVMQSNNRKQALLPATAQLIDNPMGTACGFELDIGHAHFYFTPGVPKELHLMLGQQIVPRLLARTGAARVARLKRFHVFGLGESHVDEILEGVETFAAGGYVKLGFQTHYPQLEVKLTARGGDSDELARRLAPAEAEVRRRLGNFIVAEDDETLESIVIAALLRQQASVSVLETLTGGAIAARLAQHLGGEVACRRGIVVPGGSQLEDILGLPANTMSAGTLNQEALGLAARALLQRTGTTHALVALADRTAHDTSQAAAPTLWFAIASAKSLVVRSSQPRLISEEWLRAGAVEMALDSFRRFLQGLPVGEKTDFEGGARSASK